LTVVVELIEYSAPAVNRWVLMWSGPGPNGPASGTSNTVTLTPESAVKVVVALH
jgi:hypothetical protein